MNIKNGIPEHKDQLNPAQNSAHAAYDELLHAQKITIQDVLDHLTGPVISIAVHVILLTLVATLLTGSPPPANPKVPDIQYTDVKVIEFKIPPKPPEPPDNPPTEPVESKFTADAPSEKSVEIDGPVVEEVGSQSVDTVVVVDIMSIPDIKSKLKAPMLAIRGEKGRKKGLDDYKGTTAGEKAVTVGLGWLADHQNEDGSWGTAQQGAMTGLAVLCFLGHGETPASPKYRKTIISGIKRLTEFADSMADEKGLISSPGNGYGHAIVGYALAEAANLTNIPKVKESMDKVISSIVRGQNSLGSYDYMLKTNNEEKTGQPRCDLSVAGWNYQALKAAYSANAKVEGLEEALFKAVKAISTVHAAKNGGFSYAPGGAGTHSMTAVGTLCLQLLGDDGKGGAKKGLKYLESIKIANSENSELSMDWKDAPPNPLYTWYYQTQAIFQGHDGKGKQWDKWNNSFNNALVKEQEKDGHWETPQVKYAEKKLDPKTGKVLYSGLETIGASPDGENMDMKVYSTALCVLMLEVYYRYLPSYKLQGSHAEAAESKQTLDDLGAIIE